MVLNTVLINRILAKSPIHNVINRIGIFTTGKNMLSSELTIDNESAKKNDERALIDQKLTKNEMLKMKLEKILKTTVLVTNQNVKDETMSQEASSNNIKISIHKIHLSLIEYLLNEEESDKAKEYVHQFNKMFESWFESATEKFENEDILNAFELCIHKDISLLKCFNRIYKFNQNFELLKPKIDSFINTNPNDYEKLFLLTEMKIKGYADKVNPETVFVKLIKYNSFNEIFNLIENKNKYLNVFIASCKKMCQ
jgi:hypothetical protein